MASATMTVTVTTEHRWRYWSPRKAASWFRRMHGRPFGFRVLAAFYLGALRVRVGG